ncbi:serine/threonine-protein kinase [Nocardia pneumoniae]|uniref:serine/threonine-protein kinase n=1 Tax=Nocardia pneumoniae TaxID=228601 RepID=UPI0002DF26BD|nr:serine/threonine-protein kinase [Nocardia pneumoniae]
MQESGPRTGTRFGPYELRSLLGKGGMGEVYEAYDTLKDRLVAVKLLSEELAKDPMYQVRFRRESQAAARLAEPHVIPIHDWGVIDGVLFIDMRLVRGVDLRTLLRGQGPLSPVRAVGIVEQIASALDAAHAANLVHRDVKPANILVTDDDFAYLADFGIAHTEGDSAVTLVGMAVGSYIYMAPERFDVGPVTGRADVYSLACVLHECLTGATPFPANSMNVLIKSHLSDPPPRPSAQARGIPPALDAVITRGMAKNPADRFPTATALAEAARAALAPAPSTGPMLVVRAPDRAQRPGEPTASGAAVSPESTGELSVAAVIHPSAPTVVRPTETQFTPLPSAGEPPPTPLVASAPSPPKGGLPPMRPFPDAHLYPETEAYLESAGYPQTQAYSAPPTQAYPGSYAGYAPHEPAGAAQAYSEYPSAENPAPGVGTHPEQAYPETPTVQAYSEMSPQAPAFSAFAETPPHPGAENYPETEQYPDHGFPTSPRASDDVSGYPVHQDLAAPTQYLAPAHGHATRTDYPPQGDYPVRADYPPLDDHAVRDDHPPQGGYPVRADDLTWVEFPPNPDHSAQTGDQPQADHPPRDDYPVRADYPSRHDDPDGSYDYDDADYSSSRPGRSIALPIMVAVLAIVVVTVGGALAWQSLGSGGVETTSAGRQSDTPTPGVNPIRPQASPPTSSAASTSAKPTPVTLPAGAKPCGQGQAAAGAFTQSAAGTAVTSCAFAEEVRRAYAELGTSQNTARDAPRTVVATSPVTGRTYTMNCQSEGQLVVCSGGENAVVYVY